MRLLVFIYIILYSLTGITAASADNTHTKTINTDPMTVTILSDSYTDQGITFDDLAGKLLLAAHKQITEDITLNFMSSSMKREWKMLENKDDICIYNKTYSPERSQIGIYSKFPLLAFPPNRLITTKATKLPESLSIHDALNKYNLRVGIVNGRSYGNALDKIFESNPNNILHLEGTTSSDRLIMMLLNERIDAIVEYWPTVVVSNVNDRYGPLENYQVHRLNETQQFSYGHLICSKSDFGQRVINLFDNVMEQKSYFEQVLLGHKNDMPKEEFQYIREALMSTYQQN